MIINKYIRAFMRNLFTTLQKSSNAEPESERRVAKIFN
jgi:hypothetical protein